MTLLKALCWALIFIIKLESVGPTFSSLESKMAPSNECEYGGKRDNSGRNKAPRWWKSKEII